MPYNIVTQYVIYLNLTPMNYETIKLEEFYIIGISVKTSNANGQAYKDVGELWVKFLEEDLITQIPDKESDDIYCVYTDHKTDFTSPYTAIVGCRVKTLEKIPNGFISKTIPAATYQVYTATGKLPESVMYTWQYIWQSPVNRRYSGDFDIYEHDLYNLEEAKVKVYVSVC